MKGLLKDFSKQLKDDIYLVHNKRLKEVDKHRRAAFAQQTQLDIIFLEDFTRSALGSFGQDTNDWESLKDGNQDVRKDTLWYQ